MDSTGIEHRAQSCYNPNKVGESRFCLAGLTWAGIMRGMEDKISEGIDMPKIGGPIQRNFILAKS
jgi:hypothetical protein